MTKDEARQEIECLTRRLRRLQYEYYVLSQPTQSDAEYDRLFDRLVELEKRFPEFAAPDSPTVRVGSDLSADFPEVRHTIPVLSLDKATTYTQVLEWMRKIEEQAEHPISFVCEEKIDGASIVLTYERGVLMRAVTRGNGAVGNDVTANVKTIRSVPLSLPRPIDVTVRGEIFLPRALFDKINAEQETPYANPRNLASGTLRRVKSSEVARVPLDIFVYEGFFPEPPATHLEVIEELVRLEFKVNPRIGFFSAHTDAPLGRSLLPMLSAGRLEDVRSFIEKTARERSSLPYEIDGLVFKVNEIHEREKVGYTGHHPRWAIAFKFDAPEGVAKVLKIDVQVGRTGRITPVARIEPVVISGSTVSNVTLHNQEYIDLLELAEGDTVSVSKRGDVIPAVERVLEKNDCGRTTWRMPIHCPACGSTLEKIGAHHFCRNTECPDKLRGELRFFAGRDQMDIESLGEETIDLLFEKGFIRYIEDIYTFNPDVLLALPGFGEKKVALIKEGIARSKERPFRTVLAGLGIPELGKKAAELLVDSGFDSIDALLELADRKDPAPLLAIKGIGEKMAAQILEAFADPAMRHRIAALRRCGLQLKEKKDQAESLIPRVFQGQVWCVTGSLDSFKPRELAMEEVKKRGGTVVASVSSKTTHLLAGKEAGSKLEKAKNLGVKIVTEDEFLSMLRLPTHS